jgi:GntR family transcriptional regulator
MDFVVDQHSPLPAYVQFQEQIKIALLHGDLRPGDTLPSIRDVEKQIGVSRNIVRKAYLGLQRSGILNMHHGKGVLVQRHLSYNGRAGAGQRCEELSKDVLSNAARLGISPSAFARYLYQQARERETKIPFVVFVDSSKSLCAARAATISSVWQINVPGISIDELRSMTRRSLKQIHKILTNYLRFDEVRQIVKGSGVDVIPVGLTFTAETVREFRRFPTEASVVLILDDRDYLSISLMLEPYHKIMNPSVRLSAMPLSKVSNLSRFVDSQKFHKVIISNRLWDDIPEAVKQHPRVTRPMMDVDLSSLESVRIAAGVLI